MLLPFETVLIDNSRTLVAHDAAKEIVGQFGAHKIAYSENEEHLDINVNFNRCIDIANTDLVAIVASDDELLPTFVSDLLALADRQAEAAALFLPARIIDLRSNPAFSFPDFIKRFTKPLGSSDLVLSGEASLRSLLRGNYISMLCFRKSKLGVLRFDPALRFCGDLDLWGRILLSDRAIAGSRRRQVMHIAAMGCKEPRRWGLRFIDSRKRRSFTIKSDSWLRKRVGQVWCVSLGQKTYSN